MPRPRLPRPRLPRPRLPRRAPTPGAGRTATLSTRARGAAAAIAQRLRGAGYALSDAGYAVARVPAALGRGAREFWLSMNVYTRRRLGVALAAVAVIAAIWLVAIPTLPCSLPGGDECPPSDDAIELVPGDALAYLHLNLDPDTDQYGEASAIAARVPVLTSQVAGRLLATVLGPGGDPADFERDVGPWFGGEAALAVVPTAGGVPEEIQLFEADDEGAALRFARRIASGPTDRADYRGVELTVDSRGLATTLVGGFLVVGTEDGVREAIDAGTGAAGTRSLDESEAADAARDDLPGHRFADAYVSAEGVAELGSGSIGGVLGQLAPFVNPVASRGVAAALVADDGSLEVELRSVLEPARTRSNPGFFGAFAPFEPELAEDLPAETLAYAGIGDPGRALRELLEQASAAEPGLAAAFAELAGRVRAVGGVDLERELLPALGSEAAFTMQPAPQSARGDRRDPPEELPGIASPPGDGVLGVVDTPFLEFIGSGVDEPRALEALARLQGPVAEEFGPFAGLQAGAFEEREIEGVTTQGLRVSPTLDLAYAVFDETVVVATNPEGVAQVARGDGGLGDSGQFEDATSGFPSEPSLLVYLDLDGLLALAEEAGLAADPAYATFAQEIRRLGALGVAVESSPDGLTSRARLVIEAVDTEPGTGEESPAVPAD